MEKVTDGFRRFIGRFESRDGAINFGGQVVEVVERRPPTTIVAEVEFWADGAVAFVEPGASFKIWMGDVVGNGRVLGARPGAVAPGLVSYDLKEPERHLLRAGINDWGGPSRCTNAMAIAMGFAGVEDLFLQGARIGERLRHGEPMAQEDWSRAMLALEVCFASSLGSTNDWPTTTGFSDEDSIRMIRRLQRKIPVRPTRD